MAIIVGGKVYINGMYVGSEQESKITLTDGTIPDITYTKPRVYVVC
jgi:hypothetical protein